VTKDCLAAQIKNGYETCWKTNFHYLGNKSTGDGNNLPGSRAARY